MSRERVGRDDRAPPRVPAPRVCAAGRSIQTHDASPTISDNAVRNSTGNPKAAVCHEPLPAGRRVPAGCRSLRQTRGALRRWRQSPLGPARRRPFSAASSRSSTHATWTIRSEARRGGRLSLGTFAWRSVSGIVRGNPCSAARDPPIDRGSSRMRWGPPCPPPSSGLGANRPHSVILAERTPGAARSSPAPDRRSAAAAASSRTCSGRDRSRTRVVSRSRTAAPRRPRRNTLATATAAAATPASASMVAS